MVKGNCSSFTNIFTSVSKTSSAGICNFIACCRTLITRKFNYFNHIGIFLISAHCNLYTFRKNCSFFIYTTTHSRRFSGYNHFRDFKKILKKCVLPSLPCHFTKYFIFQMLYLCIKLSHCSHSLEITYFNPFTHLLEALGKFFNKIHFNAEIYRQIRVLMCRINSSAYIEIYICCFFKQKLTD